MSHGLVAPAPPMLLPAVSLPQTHAPRQLLRTTEWQSPGAGPALTRPERAPAAPAGGATGAATAAALLSTATTAEAAASLSVATAATGSAAALLLRSRES